MRALTVLFALLLGACATHNAHRIPIDFNADLAPLIDEAWSGMEEAWRQPVPVGGVPVAIAVEKVDVQWLPFSPEVGPGGEVIKQPELVAFIQEALRPRAPPAGPDAQHRVRIGLLTDLHQPDALQIQVECDLLDEAHPGRVLAHGQSIIVRFERLYCHGCRDRWYGHGTRLGSAGPGPGGAYVEGGAFLFYYPGSSPGYHKN